VLAEALRDAEQGRSRLSLVCGEAGIGKTRLVTELEADARERGFLVLHGECVEFGGEDLPYAPIVAALRDLPAELVTQALTDMPTGARRQLETFLPATTEPRAGGGSHPRLSGGAGQGHIFELLLGLLRRLAQRMKPILLVFEDLHWGDRSSGSFVAFLLRNLDEDRLMLVATYRTDARGVDDRLDGLVAELARHARTSRLELASLSRAEVGSQIGQIAGEAAAPGVVDEIYARAGGNPFYVEELLCRQLDGRDDSVSATVADIARARVRALDRPTRHLLQLVAAAGGHVSVAVLADIISPDDLADAVRHAVDAHLVVCEGGGDRVSFRHGLIGDAVYEELLPIERMQLHRAIACALVDEPDTGSARIAYHWYRAGEHAIAFGASVRAGRAAVRVYAFAEARPQFERALELWDGLPPGDRTGDVDRAGLLTHLAEAARFTGDYDAAIRCCREALESLDVEADALRAAMLYERIGEYSFDDDVAALASYRTALSLLPADAHAERAWVFSAEGRALLRMRRPEEARARCQDALLIAGEARAERVTTAALATLGMALTMLGDSAAGLQRLREALDMARAQGSAEDLGHAWMHLAETYRLQGCHEEALRAMIDAEAEARRCGAQGSFGAFLRVNAVDDLLRLGRWDDAEHQLTGCANGDLGSTGGLLCEALRGHLQVLRGDLAGARKSLERAAEMLLRDGSFADFVPAVEGGWAMLELAERRPADAHARVTAALVAMADADAEETFYTPILHVLGMQALAELAENARAHRASDELSALHDRARALLASLDELLLNGVDRSHPPDARANRTLVQAEFLRVLGEPATEAWAATTRRWEELSEPYPAAYARLRHAEAHLLAGLPRAPAESLLRAAHATATSLGAARLRCDVEDLARRARVDLEHDAEPAGAIAPPVRQDVHDFGLTAREIDVLGLLAEGLTTREIGERLFISRKTADTHISHIFEKLGVHSRVEAAGVAQRSGVINAHLQAG
jgi:DNA-binding CsgD family transcriptional regulator/tetratricopeptide (TPR) repeat protein